MRTTVTTRQGTGPAFDVTTASAARIYDYLLGGKDHFTADRQAGYRLTEALPGIVRACRDNRDFLQRAVRYLAGQGIRQFLDIGTGLPAMGSVHEAAQQAAPGARVAYVDYDPVVITHARALLAGTPGVIAVPGDLRHPEAITTDPDVRRHLDLTRPVAVLCVAVLHFITDAEQPRAITARLMDAMMPGSWLAITHATADHVTEQAAADARDVYATASAPVTPRTLTDVTSLFDGLKLAEPGVTGAADWHLEIPPYRPHGQEPRQETYIYAGVAMKH